MGRWIRYCLPWPMSRLVGSHQYEINFAQSPRYLWPTRTLFLEYNCSSRTLCNTWLWNYWCKYLHNKDKDIDTIIVSDAYHFLQKSTSIYVCIKIFSFFNSSMLIMMVITYQSKRLILMEIKQRLHIWQVQILVPDLHIFLPTGIKKSYLSQTKWILNSNLMMPGNTKDFLQIFPSYQF